MRALRLFARNAVSSRSHRLQLSALLIVALTLTVAPAWAQPPEPVAEAQHQAGGEANLVLPDLNQVSFRGVASRTLLMGGLGVCALGLVFGLVIYSQIRRLPAHRVPEDLPHPDR